MISNEKRFEGNVPFMYLDTVGKVTVGVGKMIPTAAAAVALPFVEKSDGSIATEEAITTEFNNVTGLEPGHVASFYDEFTTLKLSQPDIDAQLTTDLQAVESQLQATFTGYDSFSASAQEGLIDMAFNLGIGKLVNGFPNFTAAVRVQDWATAAAECHRNGISDDRNDFVQALFIAASQP